MKVLIFLQTLHIFERTFTVLEEKVFGRDVKIESYSLRLITSIKKSIFESSLFFKFFRILNEPLPCLAKKFCAGISKNEICTLCLQSIMLGIKINFWKFCKLPFYSELENKFFGFVATEFSPGLSKLHFTCLFEFSLRCWY